MTIKTAKAKFFAGAPVRVGKGTTLLGEGNISGVGHFCGWNYEFSKRNTFGRLGGILGLGKQKTFGPKLQTDRQSSGQDK